MPYRLRTDPGHWQRPGSAAAACSPGGTENAASDINVTIDEVGNATAFLCARTLASGITGDVLCVDSGYHILGMAWSQVPEREADRGRFS